MAQFSSLSHPETPSWSLPYGIFQMRWLSPSVSRTKRNINMKWLVARAARH